MTLYNYTHYIIASVLIVLAGYMLPIFVRRFPHVGWRYQAAVVSGYVFAICTIVTYVLDYNQWPNILQLISLIQVLAGVVLTGVSFGHMDIVFNGRRQWVKGSR